MSVDFILPNRNKIQTIAYASASKKYVAAGSPAGSGAGTAPGSTDLQSWRRPKPRTSGTRKPEDKPLPVTASSVLRNANGNGNQVAHKLPLKSMAKRNSRSVLKREIIELEDDEDVEEEELCEHLEWSAAQSLVQMNSSKQEKQRRAGATASGHTAQVAGPAAASGESL